MTVHTDRVPRDLVRTLQLLTKRVIYPDAVLDLLQSDLDCYGWCCQRVYADGSIERINPRDMSPLSDEATS